ncbi:MAG: hypothetical protein LBI10_03495, partial [Deltaproteobacteria bacterium]|jgi:tRNA1(Val) A37 N6-methylase TrmN6|nr:hypothetical protein [Deltaproteobacteria bacterium]
VDLGCGCGVVGLEALAKNRLKGLEALYFVERQWTYQAYLTHNLTQATKARATPRLYALMVDWRSLTPMALGGRVDYAICNPPWRPVSFRGSQNPAKRAAREALYGDLIDLLLTAQTIIKPYGRLTLAWPSADQATLRAALAKVTALKLSRVTIVKARKPWLILADLTVVA